MDYFKLSTDCNSESEDFLHEVYEDDPSCFTAKDMEKRIHLGVCRRDYVGLYVGLYGIQNNTRIR